MVSTLGRCGYGYTGGRARRRRAVQQSIDIACPRRSQRSKADRKTDGHRIVT